MAATASGVAGGDGSTVGATAASWAAVVDQHGHGGHEHDQHDQRSPDDEEDAGPRARVVRGRRARRRCRWPLRRRSRHGRDRGPGETARRADRGWVGTAHGLHRNDGAGAVDRGPGAATGVLGGERFRRPTAPTRARRVARSGRPSRSRSPGTGGPVAVVAEHRPIGHVRPVDAEQTLRDSSPSGPRPDRAWGRSVGSGRRARAPRSADAAPCCCRSIRTGPGAGPARPPVPAPRRAQTGGSSASSTRPGAGGRRRCRVRRRLVGRRDEARAGGQDGGPHRHADVHGRLVVMTGATAVAGVALRAPQLEDTRRRHPIGPFPADRRSSGGTAQRLTGRGEDLTPLGDGQIGGQRATVEGYRPAPDLHGRDTLGRSGRVHERPDSHHHGQGDEGSPAPGRTRRSKGNHGGRTSGRGSRHYMTVR